MNEPLSQISFLAKTLALAALLLILGACSARIGPLEESLAARSIPFLRAGETTQQEIFHRLGVPHGSYENGFVLTFRMGEDAEGRMFVLRGETRLRARYFYELVLVFGTNLVLEKYTLVRKQ
jgi:hypothetical protein